MMEKIKRVKQGNLTSDCWAIQIWGITYCDTCEFLDTTDCGGQSK